MATIWLLGVCFLPLLLLPKVDSTIPMQLPPRLLPEEGKGVCPSEDSRQAQRSNFTNDVVDLLRQYLQTCDNGLTPDSAVSSCADIPATCESGMRYVTTSDGKTESVYCEASPPFSNHTWMRLAALDMTDSSQSCPMHWSTYNNEEHKIRACGRSHTQEEQVAQAVFSTSGIMYSKCVVESQPISLALPRLSLLMTQQHLQIHMSTVFPSPMGPILSTYGLSLQPELKEMKSVQQYVHAPTRASTKLTTSTYHHLWAAIIFVKLERLVHLQKTARYTSITYSGMDSRAMDQAHAASLTAHRGSARPYPVQQHKILKFES